jgi:MoaA/NifB/PqqE/SkfB family radical SAM enzyme
MSGPIDLEIPMTILDETTVGVATARPLRFMWLELTGKCQLECSHCYADSGPSGTHGTMTVSDWEAVIDEAAIAGVKLVQFIGGEPTLHPDLPYLIRYVLSTGIQVEVYSNLVHVTPALWKVFSLPGVRLATSYYSDNRAQHRQVTRRDTYRPTRANIAEAVRRGIPVRVGVVDVRDGQRISEAVAELKALGVTSIKTDRVRALGRGGGTCDVGQLCGACGRGVAAISPTGEVWPCIMSRWMPAGSVREDSLADIVASQTWLDLVATIPETHGAVACHPVAELSAERCHPTVEVSAERCHPTVEVSAERCHPSVEVSAERCHPTVEVSAERCHPSVEVSAERCHPSVEVSAGRCHPTVELSAERCHPSVEASAGRCHPTPEAPEGGCAPTVQLAERCAPAIEASALEADARAPLAQAVAAFGR